MIRLSNMVKLLSISRTGALFAVSIASASALAIGPGCGGGSGETSNLPAIDIVTTSLPSVHLREAYQAKIEVGGGVPPFRFALSEGQLPEGLNLATDGKISGTPAKPGRASFTVTVTDSKNQNVPIPLSIYVVPDDVEITISQLPSGKQGEPYDQTLTARGGLAPLSWSVSALPAGMMLDSSGRLAGTPEVFGTFNFRVRVTDSGVGGESRFKEQEFRLFLVSRLPMVRTATVPKGRVGAMYSATLTAQGGVAPYTFSVSSGGLPMGLALAADGTIAGTPTEDGMFTAVIHVTDALQRMDMDMYQLQIRVIPALTIATTGLPSVIRSRMYDFQVQAAGGEPPYTWALTGGNLPQGITFDGTGHFRGATTMAGSYPVTLQVQDSEGCPVGCQRSAQFVLQVSDRYIYPAQIDPVNGIPFPPVRTGTIVSYTTVPIQVTESFQVDDVIVGVNLDYTDPQPNDWYLRVLVFGPDGSQAVLCGNGARVPGGHRCSGASGRINQEFSDTGARPDTPLNAAFKGMNARGTWKLYVGVILPNNQRRGTIRSFSLSLKDNRSTAPYVLIRGYQKNNLVTAPFVRVCSNLPNPTRCGGIDAHQMALAATVYDVGPNGYPEAGGGDDVVRVPPSQMTWSWALTCASAGSMSTCPAQSTCLGPVAGQPGFCAIRDVELSSSGRLTAGRFAGRAPIAATGGGFTTDTVDFRVTPPDWNPAIRVY